MVKRKMIGYGAVSAIVVISLLLMSMPMSFGDQQDITSTVSTPDFFHGSFDLGSFTPEQNVFGGVSGIHMGYDMVAGDMNGDMIDDLIVSAPMQNAGKGAVYIFLGPNDDRALTASDADVAILGYEDMGLFGLNIALGDVDADGLLDLVVSGYTDHYMYGQGILPSTPETKVFLFLGASSWNTSMSSNDADVMFYGAFGTAFGWNIAVGDIDDDDYDDIIVVQMYENLFGVEGELFIWKGRMAFETEYHVDMMEYDHHIYNSDLYYDSWGYLFNGIGSSSLELGDINGDGYLDILIGSMYKFTDAQYSGEVEVVYGGRNMLMEMDLATYSYLRISSFANYWLSHATAADIDGDGIDDLLVTAPQAFFDRTGGIFAFYGKSDMPVDDLSILDYDFMIRGPRSGFEFGVLTIGDMDGDDRDDLIIHSRMGADYDYRGCYYLLYMSETDDLPDPNVYNMKFETPSTVFKGPSGAQRFADILKPAFLVMDFDGDGLYEVVTSDSRASAAGYQPNAGVVYFFYQTETEVRLNYFDLLDGDGENGNILGAGKLYHFVGHVENTWSLEDFSKLDISLIMHGGDIEGEKIELYWDRGLMRIRERTDNFELLDIESTSVNPDGGKGMFLYMNLSFRSTVPTEEPMDMIIDIAAGKGLSVSLSKPALFRVECDVAFHGDFQVIGAINGRLSLGSFVQGGETIEVSGVRVVFEGTEASPPNSYFSIKMEDNKGNVYLNSSSSGMDIYFTFKTLPIPGKEELYITIVDLVGEADDVTGGLMFYYMVDVDLPHAPTDLIARADSDIDELTGYDDDPDVWIVWTPSSDDTSNIVGYLYNTYDAGGTSEGTFVDRTKFEFKGLMEGWNTIYVWAMDEAMNYGPAESVSVYYDAEAPVFLPPNPAPGSWVNERIITYEITVIDQGGSGVLGSSIEYAISSDGARTFGAWEPTNIRRVGDRITVKLFIPLRDGVGNYVKWRAKDIAGNGYVESEPYQVKVDTIPISYMEATPELPQDSSYVVCGITVTDRVPLIGSGVDASTIQYSVSYNGVSNYGPWESLDLSGTYESITAQTPPLYFNRDTVNYIKWRAKDIAGNGWTYSDDIPVEVTEVRRNSEPVPIITTPLPNQDFDTSSLIHFDGSTSQDADDDKLTYLWYSDIDGYLGTDPVIYRTLSAGNHLITLAISDGKSNVTFSIPLKVYLSVEYIDTDGDGIPDIWDDDIDGDGLLNIEEDKNRNGLVDPGETDPRNPDTDGDGVIDSLDYAPLDPTKWKAERRDLLPSWIVWLVIFLVILLFLIVGLIFVLKQRADRERLRARNEHRVAKRNLRRFEVLTGVPTNDLPAIEAVQWALPGVIAEASEFILEAPPSEDLLPPSPEEDKEEPTEAKVSKPDLEDMETPAPAAPSMEESVSEQEPPSSGGKIVTCSLCGSEVPVAEGATSVECSLCGEIINV
ncbi:MAG: FG-GAP-like repeat-containing protein [Candidatus Thermoplasmatota archaeon]|nr:FG-GAP-like repeat-containing protein [Candidatus Thermoplasmatota archaeon]